MSDGKNMKVNMIKEVDVRLVCKIIRYKMNYSSRLNYVPTRFIHATYMMIVEREKFNMRQILRHQLLDNIDRIKKTKNASFRFKSLLKHFFFQVVRNFPSISN